MPATSVQSDSADVTKYIVDTAKQAGSQALGLYRQGARFAIDGAGAWMEAVAGLVPGLSGQTFPPAVVRNTMESWTTATFEIAEEAIRVQRELVSAVISRLAPSR